MIPSAAVAKLGLGSEFQIAPLSEQVTPDAAGGSAGASFGNALGGALKSLTEMQQTAADQSQALALGKSNDVQSVAMDVERAYLAIQLATQVRNRAVDSYHEIFRMQV